MPNGNPQNINGYAIERTSIGNDDFFDIDWFDTSDGQYKTAKVRGSVLLALIVNIYTSDGVLTGDRTIDADLNTLLIENLRKFQIDVNPAPFGATGVEFNVNPSGRLFSIKDSSTGQRRFDINQDGSVTFNQEYTFPLLDGNAGEILATDGAGQLVFIPNVAGSNIYNSNGALTTDRIVSGSFFNLWFLDVNGFIFQTSSNGIDTQNGVWFDIEEANVLTGGSLFKVRKKGGIGVGVDRFSILKNGQVQINEEYKFPLVDGLNNGDILTTDGAGNTSFQPLDLSDFVNFGSTQWSKSIPNTTLATGQTANGISFFSDSDKVLNGTTPYDEYNISFGRLLTLTGTSGTANININGVNYLATFNTTLTQTAIDFVTTHQSTLLTLGIQVFAQSGVLKFGGTNAILNTITITTLTGNLSGTLNTAIADHIVIPYLNTAYNGQRLQHEIRVNFNIQVGSNNFYQLSLRRWADDSIIGSPITIERNPDYTGQQHVFISYTANSNDPFVTGGFYFAFFNNSGQNVVFTDGSGILIQTKYQKPTKF
jgi:hypothetical protein